jgi:hypothetical protein
LELVSADLALSSSKPLVLRLQRGRVYQITAFEPENQYWLSEEIALGAAPAEIVIPAVLRASSAGL